MYFSITLSFKPLLTLLFIESKYSPNNPTVKTKKEHTTKILNSNIVSKLIPLTKLKIKMLREVTNNIKPRYKKNLIGLKVRSGNVIGGGDRAESRLMTDLINAGHNKNTINLRNPLSIRPWTYILDSLYGYIQATNYSYTEAKSEIFNLNSELDNEYTVEYITKKYCELSNNAFDVEVTPNELKEVNELRINSQKAINQLGWRAIIGVDNALEKIKNWENFYRNSSDINYSFDEVSDYLKELDE